MGREHSKPVLYLRESNSIFRFPRKTSLLANISLKLEGERERERERERGTIKEGEKKFSGILRRVAKIVFNLRSALR